MSASFPSFAAFFGEVHGRAPLPWQDELARRVADGGWPSGLAIPTGLGKTSAIDVGVWALASQAARPPARRSLPTRMWYVVNRRLLVDAAYDHAVQLAGLLAGGASPAVHAVRTALHAMAAFGTDAAEVDGGLPLHVSRLRGGAELGARPPDPSQPALVFATVPMFASRWLFRGYGSSVSMRPVDAALAGIDAVVLLDEAHLSRHLDALAASIVDCDAGDPSTVLANGRGRTQIVVMTATGDDRPGQLELGPQDMAHPLVQKRLSATKLTALVTSTKARLAATLVDRARDHLDGADPAHRTCIIFVNTAILATTVTQMAHKRMPDADVEVLTGRLRDPDAARVRDRLMGRDGTEGMRSGRAVATRSRPLVVVATQTLEVGADLDFDLLVTQSAGVRALTQRFGRLNRLGDRDAHAAATIVHVPGPDPVYGEEPDAVWQRLIDGGGAHQLDLGPGRIGMLGPPADDPGRAAVLLPAHLWEWAKTSAPPTGEAPGERFFDGLEDGLARVSVCWRAWLPAPGERPVPLPSPAETVEVPIGEVRALMEHTPPSRMRRLTGDGTLEEASRRSLRPGDTVLVHADIGGYVAEGQADGIAGAVGWVVESTRPVTDLSIFHRGTLPLHTDAVSHLAVHLGGTSSTAWVAALSELVGISQDPEAPLTSPEVVRAVADTAHVLKALEAPDPVVDLLDLLSVSPEVILGPQAIWVIAPKRTKRATDDVRLDAFDDLSVDAADVRLDAHDAAVGRAAGKLARAIGVPDDMVSTIELAGALHDLGKSDPRFQRWLDPDGQAVELLAKGSGSRTWRRDQARAGWPRGGRHELLSGRAVQTWLTTEPDLPDHLDRDLLLHLVQSHHGGGRPLVGTPRTDPTHAPLQVIVADVPVTIDADLATDDWTQPARFRRLCERYGYWGLALLEAVVRQADHAVSSRSSRTAVIVA